MGPRAKPRDEGLAYGIVGVREPVTSASVMRDGGLTVFFGAPGGILSIELTPMHARAANGVVAHDPTATAAFLEQLRTLPVGSPGSRSEALAKAQPMHVIGDVAGGGRLFGARASGISVNHSGTDVVGVFVGPDGEMFDCVATVSAPARDECEPWIETYLRDHFSFIDVPRRTAVIEHVLIVDDDPTPFAVDVPASFEEVHTEIRGGDDGCLRRFRDTFTRTETFGEEPSSIQFGFGCAAQGFSTTDVRFGRPLEWIREATAAPSRPGFRSTAHVSLARTSFARRAARLTVHVVAATEARRTELEQIAATLRLR